MAKEMMMKVKQSVLFKFNNENNWYNFLVSPKMIFCIFPIFSVMKILIKINKVKMK